MSILGYALWWLTVGITEGLIRQKQDTLWGIEYHVWRLLHLAGWALLLIPLWGWLPWLGWTLVLQFGYSRMIELAQGDGFWSYATTYQLHRWTLPWHLYIEIVAAFIGCLLLGVAYG